MQDPDESSPPGAVEPGGTERALGVRDRVAGLAARHRFQYPTVAPVGRPAGQLERHHFEHPTVTPVSRPSL